MEDAIEMILEDHRLASSKPHPMLSACIATALTGVYGVWTLFTMPGLTKIPWRLKVPKRSFVCLSLNLLVNARSMHEGRL